MMLVGLGLFLAGTLVCLLAPTIEVLVSGRLLQALGGCAGMVLSRAIVRDLYDRERAAGMIAYITMAMVLAPMLAPTIGGLLDQWAGWWSGFAFVLAVGATVLVAAWFKLHETHHEDRVPLSAIGVFSGFVRILQVRAFYGYALQLTFSSMAFFSFLGGAPYITVELMGQTPGQYGLYFMMVSVLFMAGNFTSARLSGRVALDSLISAGVLVAIIGAALQAVLFLAGELDPFTLFACMAFIAYGNGLSMPNGTAGAVSVHQQLVGAASGLTGFMQMTVAALASYVVGKLLGDSAAPMVWIMLAATLLAAAVHFLWNVLPARERPQSRI
jgi:DHA1 family bicyclomycin/chloramphenicol resistance-like MFS transporter